MYKAEDVLRSFSFDVPGQPKPKGRPRFSRKGGHVFTPKATRDAEKSFAQCVKIRAPDKPLSGPLAIEVTFMMEAPKSWPKWKRLAAIEGRLRHVSRPDVDNLAKLAKDSLNGILWNDDSQVCELIARKVYSETPRTWIVVHVLSQADRESEKEHNGTGTP